MVTPVYSLRILLLNLDDANRIKINPGKENSFPSRGSLFYPQEGSLSLPLKKRPWGLLNRYPKLKKQGSGFISPADAEGLLPNQDKQTQTGNEAVG